MSQEELSEQAGLGLKYINQLENQNVNLTIHSLEKVIDALEMTPEEFFNFDSLESTSDKTDNLSLKRINMKIKQLPIDKLNAVTNSSVLLIRPRVVESFGVIEIGRASCRERV